MTGWSDVAFGVVTAGAALGGTWLQSILNNRSLSKADAREDLAALREKYHEVMIELENFIVGIHRTTTHLLIAMQKNEAIDEAHSAPTTAKLRSLVALYFPEGLPAIDEFERLDRESMEQMVEAVRGDYAQARAENAVYNISCARNSRNLGEELKRILSETAKGIGLSKDDVSGI